MVKEAGLVGAATSSVPKQVGGSAGPRARPVSRSGVSPLRQLSVTQCLPRDRPTVQTRDAPDRLDGCPLPSRGSRRGADMSQSQQGGGEGGADARVTP